MMAATASPHRAVVGAAAVLITVTVAGGSLAGCDSQAGSATSSSPRQVTVIGSGQVQGAPDTLTAQVGIEVVAPDATAAMNQTSDRQRAVIDSLTAGGTDAKDISTTTVNLQPQYGENSVITGYRASNSIRVTLRELDAASETLALVVAAGLLAAGRRGLRRRK